MNLVESIGHIKKAHPFMTDGLTLLGLIVPLLNGIIPGLFQGECSMILQFELSFTHSRSRKVVLLSVSQKRCQNH